MSSSLPRLKGHTSIAVIGGGLAGMATAARLAARGRRVLVLEAHRTIGGCCGYFRRRGFAFDVGCTTLVDYRPGGVGGLLMSEIGLPDSLLEHLPGYRAWMGQDSFDLPADVDQWRVERARALGDTPHHRRLWALLDGLADAFTIAARRGARMPLRTGADLIAAAKSMPLRHWPLLRYLRWTLADAVIWAGLEHDERLRAFLSMVVQDTVHSEPCQAPLVNSSLGLAIRGAIARPKGGMFGFWQAFEARAIDLGVRLETSAAVQSIAECSDDERGRFRITTSRDAFVADVVVCTLPIWDAARIGPPSVAHALRPWCERDASSIGGAALLTMGVPEEEVSGHTLTHHQFLPRPGAPLGDGNNCFLSISSAGDNVSAPAGHRVVMISTHVDVEKWPEEMSPEEHAGARQQLGEQLLRNVRVAYPGLGQRAQWLAVASPRTYSKFTRRHRGSVGGMRLTLTNSNQRAVPHDIGVEGWIQAGDTTWPGLGTTACAMCSDIAATRACNLARD